MIAANGLIALVRRIWGCGMPEGTPPPLRRGCRLTLAAAIPLWAIGTWGTWVPWRLVPNVRDAAVVALVLAGVWWGQAQGHDDQVRALIRQNGDFYRRIPEDDRPPLLQLTSGR